MRLNNSCKCSLVAAIAACVSIAGEPVHAQEQPEFANLDADLSGSLSLSEVLNGSTPEHEKKIGRNFEIVDWDRSGELSLEEFKCLPSAGGDMKLRGSVPDPIVDQALRHVDTVASSWEMWDVNKDGRLANGEFSTAAFNQKIPGLKSTTFSDWDLDQDGAVSQDEVVKAINASFGIKHLNGNLLRQKTGAVFAQDSFRWRDVDKNGFLTSKELQIVNKMDPVKANELVQQLDVDGDGSLSHNEAWGMLSVDVLAKFCRGDKDLNGVLSPHELTEMAFDKQKQIAAFAIPAFDVNKDGELSFSEFRLTQFANFDEDWHTPRKDTNADGLLSWPEFSSRRHFDSLAVSALIFESLDISGDQQLDANEFYFKTPVRDFHNDFMRADADGNDSLTLEELVNFEPPKKKQVLTRDFSLVDWNRSKSLSFEEFMCLPQFVSTDSRGDIPDPIGQLAAGKIELIEQKWAAWKPGSQSGIPLEEVPLSDLIASVPGLKNVEISTWDINTDEQLTLGEVRIGVEVAFGLKKRTGEVLRKPNGVVYNLEAFSWRDADKDGVLSSQNLQKIEKIDASLAAAKIDALDSNGDNVLSHQESWSMFSSDTLNDFRRKDKDLSGTLSHEEIVDSAGYQKSLAEYALQAFDGNSSGELDFVEYRLTPFANKYLAWQNPRRDKDGDGLLSFAEFSPPKTTDHIAIMKITFDRLDTSNDNMLDQNEFFYTTPVRYPEKEFRLADTDSDGVLSIDEFLLPNRKVREQHRDFLVFDSDRNGSLTYAEYLMVPQRTSLLQRTDANDPIVAIAENVVLEIRKLLPSNDLDDDVTVSATEFREAKVARSLPGLELSGFADWDLDNNGAVTIQECRQFVFAAFGLGRLDGIEYRKVSGATSDLNLFRHADKNNDQVVSHSEYMERGYGGDTAGEKFADGDENGDGRLSLREWSLCRHWLVDPVTNFLKWDVDLDGYVSNAELMNRATNWQSAVTQYYLPAFDSDGDQKLSLAEFRLLPVSNPVRNWFGKPRDADNDGKISFTEFQKDEGVEGAALAKMYFSRFDIDNSGAIEFGELEYSVNVLKAPAAIVFASRNRNNDAGVDLDELLGDRKNNPSEWARKEAGAIQSMFLDSDLDGDGVLTLVEFESGRDSASKSSANSLSQAVSRNDESKGNRFWMLVLFNVALVGGVGWYALFRK